jgi:regulator of nonsense transcripts 2
LADEIIGPSGSLDSSLKKHTNLLNKLKTNLLASPPEALLKDIDGLTLTKYLEEIVAAIVEGAGKGKGDPEAAIEVSSAARNGPPAHDQVIVQLHTRLTPDFLPHLLPPFLAVLAQPPVQSTGKEEKDREKEEKERLSRQRPVLRIVADLAMIGGWQAGPAKGGAEVQKVIKGLVRSLLIELSFKLAEV